jgi:hypothetical protein
MAKFASEIYRLTATDVVIARARWVFALFELPMTGQRESPSIHATGTGGSYWRRHMTKLDWKFST